MLAYINGTFCSLEKAKVPALDRGFLFGDGVYEVICCYEGKPYQMKEHLQRYQRGVKELALWNAPSVEELQNLCSELLLKSGMQNGIIYLQVTRGAALRQHNFPAQINPTVFLYTAPPPFLSQEDKLFGVKTILVPDLRWNRCDIKTINLLPNCLAKEAAFKVGTYEAILFHHSLGITEGSSTSFFAVKGKTLWTAPNGPNILPGITRGTVINIAHDLGIRVIEEFLAPEHLSNFDEAFLTGTSINVVPIRQIDEIVFPVERYKLTRLLQNELELYIKNQINY